MSQKDKPNKYGRAKGGTVTGKGGRTRTFGYFIGTSTPGGGIPWICFQTLKNKTYSPKRRENKQKYLIRQWPRVLHLRSLHLSEVAGEKSKVGQQIFQVAKRCPWACGSPWVVARSGSALATDWVGKGVSSSYEMSCVASKT